MNTKKLKNFIGKFSPNWNKVISWYVIDLKSGHKTSQNPDVLLYPASSYKIYIAAAALRQVRKGLLDLNKNTSLMSDFVQKNQLYPIIQKTLRPQQNITIEHLIKLMLQQSDNRAANSLTTEVGLDYIDENFGGITQKFKDSIKRRDNDVLYSEKLAVSARGLAEFMARLDSGGEDGEIKKYMQNAAPPSDGLLKNTIFYKAGYLELEYKSGPSWFKKLCRVRYRSQAAIVNDGEFRYAVGIMTRCNSLRFGSELDLSKFQKAMENRLKTLNR
ncbi:MAG: class A beta-lactamase-related serine hydrolase [Rickettsiales bacterium]|nr:class A beta-lactamase-related serine hydrolase [Rickettsiales bacterium]